MKRLIFPSGLIAAVLAVSSCAEIAMVPVAAVALPLTAAFMIGFAGVATLSQVQEGFDTQQRKREEKPRKDGPFIEYWPNGKKSAAGSYKNKMLNGAYTEYYENGKKKSELTYDGGERNGPYISWFESGQKATEGTFKDGKKVSFRIHMDFRTSKGKVVEMLAYYDPTQRNAEREAIEAAKVK